MTWLFPKHKLSAFTTAIPEPGHGKPCGGFATNRATPSSSYMLNLSNSMAYSASYCQRKSVALTIKIELNFMHILSPTKSDLIHMAPTWEIIYRSLSNFHGFSIGLNPFALWTCGEGREAIKNGFFYVFPLSSVYLYVQNNCWQSWLISLGCSLSLNKKGKKSLFVVLISNVILVSFKF